MIRIRHWFQHQPVAQLRPAPAAHDVAHGDGDRFLLADQHDQPLPRVPPVCNRFRCNMGIMLGHAPRDRSQCRRTDGIECQIEWRANSSSTAFFRFSMPRWPDSDWLMCRRIGAASPGQRTPQAGARKLVPNLVGILPLLSEPPPAFRGFCSAGGCAALQALARRPDARGTLGNG
jgi:hypothetical protein